MTSHAAPTYAWTCFACDKANPAGSARCVHCGFSSVACVPAIQAERRAQGWESALETPQPAPAKPPEPPEPFGVFQVFWMFLFGAYCLVGAYSSLSSDQWPIYLPPQLDIFGVLLGPTGGGIVAGLLGLMCVLGAVAAGVKIAQEEPVPTKQEAP